jgi:hypothetical protein
MAEWIVSYEIVEGGNPTQLADEVTRRIATGWQPWGAPYPSGGAFHCQAVVRTLEGLARFENERRRQGEAVETG